MEPVTVDTDIEELKQEVEELKEMTADTNRQVHKMRRGARWSLLFQIVWWLTVLGITGAGYYYYVQPYVQKLEGIYAGAQQSGAQAQNWGQQVQEFFSKYFTAPGTPAGPQQ